MSKSGRYCFGLTDSYIILFLFWNGDILSASRFCRAGGSAVAYLFLQETLYNNMQQVPYCVPPYFFVARRCLPLAGLFLALMLAAAQVAAQQTTLVTITAVGAVGLSGLVEVVEDDDVVFELTRTGDLTSPLTVTVEIDEPRDADRVLEETAPFEKTVIFPAGQSTVQLRENTNADDEFEEDTVVTAVLAPAAVAEGESGYYAAASAGSASVLVLDDDIPEMRVYAATTQVRISEGGELYLWRAILEADERPHNRPLVHRQQIAIDIFSLRYLLEKESVSAASADDVSRQIPGGDFGTLTSGLLNVSKGYSWIGNLVR